MLKWDLAKRLGHAVFYAKAAVGSDAVALHEALVAMWSKVLDELDKQATKLRWEILVTEFVTQCGSFDVYPASEATIETSVPKFSIDLTVDKWAIDYGELPDTNKGTHFERAYERFHQARLDALIKAIQDKRVASRFAKLRRRRSFAVFCVDEGESFLRDRMEFLWGNCPRKRQFKTAKELFEHTLRKAHLTPEYSMRLRGKVVTGVNWFGREFTDKYVDLMEEVPNAGHLCAGLRDFMLTATRITPSGVKRLKKLFPHVRFTVVSGRDCVNKGIDPWYKPRYLGGQES